MAKALVRPSSPQKYPSAKRTSAPSLKNIGNTLFQELREIVERLGEDHPDLISELLRYIAGLDDRHPEWRVPMDRARDRLVGGKLGGHIHRRTH